MRRQRRRKMEGGVNEQKQGEGEMQRDGEFFLAVKVMTDEQIGELRKQIAAYAIISEQLVQMYNNFCAQLLAAAGTSSWGNLYSEQFQASFSHKIPYRHRWAPTTTQLKILEHLFDRSNGSPGKNKIKEITTQLAQHGEITIANVYNWFQNRRSRSKRKKAEFDIETKPKKKTKSLTERSENFHFDQSPLSNPEMIQTSKDKNKFRSDGSSISSHTNAMRHSRIEDQLFDKMEAPWILNSCYEEERFHNFG